MRRATTRAGAIVASVLTVFATISVVSGAPPAAALTGSQFNPGNIISDTTFYNAAAMTATSIQNFLVSKASSNCAGASPACVRDYHANITAQPAESGLCTALSAQSNVSAAQIFATIAQACGVNPQALLVTAQKESSLVTTSSPNYTTTMGYGCPDSVGCNAKYYGFFNQVYLAARQFKLYRKNPDNYGYVAGTTTFILYNPKTSCGGTNVFIQNQATAGLYDYTPYQPNAAALANLHGSGDSCSAYGNRNFWVFFNEWFGSSVQNISPQPYDRGGFAGVKPDGSLWYYVNGGALPHPILPGAAVYSGLTPYLNFASGDVTGDGRADLVAHTAAGTLWLFVNNGGSAPFGAPIKIGFSGWAGFNHFRLADINDDGRADLLVTTTDGHAYAYLNSGSNTLPIGQKLTLGTGWDTFAHLTVGDVDSDGYADVIATKADGSLWLLHNTRGTSPFGSWVRYGTTDFSSYATIFGDDTNADGRADLVARRPDGSLWLFVNTTSLSQPYGPPIEIGYSGWSSFSALLSLTVPVPHRNVPSNPIVRDPSDTGSLSTFQNASPPDPFTTHSTIGASGWNGYRLVVSADLAGDGKSALIAVDKTGNAWLLRNTGVPTHPYSSIAKIATGWGSLSTILAADVNGDGKADLVAVSSTGALYLYVNTGSPTAPFGNAVGIGYSGWKQFPALALADITGDHFADILATNQDGTLRVYPGNGSITHPFSTYTTIGSSGWQKFSQIVALTHRTAAGLGPADLLGISSDGRAAFYRNIGLASRPYVASIALPGTPFAGQAQLSAAPITGSGNADIVATTPAGTGTLVLDPNQGTDVFGAPVLIGSSGWNSFGSIAVGDVTGDGMNDLIAIKPIGSMYLYSGADSDVHPFAAGVVIGMSGWQNFDRVMVADLTGDGLADLVATKPDGTVWLYQADTTVGHPYGAIPARQIGAGWQAFADIALGDVNRDGLPDMIGTKADGSLWLLLNQHKPSAPFGAPIQIGTGWQAYNRLLLGDVDHDGYDDILATRPDGTAWYWQNLFPSYPATPFRSGVPTTPGSWTSYDIATF